MNISNTTLKYEHTPTNEQQAIIDHCLTGESLVVQAFAGATKSSTLQMVSIAMDSIGKKGLYLAFNKVVATEAKGKMKCESMTTHSLAYRNVSKDITKRLSQQSPFPNIIAKQFNISPVDVKKITKGGNEVKLKIQPNIIIQMAKKTVANFCNSDLSTPDITNVFLYEWMDKFIVDKTQLEYAVLECAKAMWNDMGSKYGIIPVTHDYYLKRFMMSDTTLPYDYIMVDEFQDVNPCVLEFIVKQLNHGTQIIVVGDSSQAIYQWRGAVDALKNIEKVGIKTLHLTKSFRFGDLCGKSANLLLKNLLGKEQTLVDNGNAMQSTCEKFKTHIYRSNAGALEAYLEYKDVHKDEPVHLSCDLSGVKSFLDAWYSMNDPKPKVHTLLSGFNNQNEVVEYVQSIIDVQTNGDKIATVNTSKATADDLELVKLFNLTKKYGKRLYYVIKEVVPIDVAETIFITAHKSKGLEWDSVIIGDDFISYSDWCEECLTEGVVDVTRHIVPEINLMYVAITRAKNVLNWNVYEPLTKEVIELMN